MFIHERQRLFALRNNTTMRMYCIGGEVVYFDRKFQAKEVRDELENSSRDTYTVIPGPDNTFYAEGDE